MPASSRHELSSLILALMLSALTASCVEDDSGLDFSEAQAAIAFASPPFYDSYGTCIVGGVQMHCCPAGTVLVGLHANHNVFKCRQTASQGGFAYLDVGTMRNGMHSCPLGSVMIGYHKNSNYLACQTLTPAPTVELIDASTNDSYPMHVCPDDYAMAGIHLLNNRFTCAR